MKVLKEQKGDIAVLRLRGTLMGGPDSKVFDEALSETLQSGAARVLVDMADISWVNSTGLGILIAGHRTVSSKGGSLKLLHVSKRIESLLMVTKLNTLFESYDDEAQAVASFSS
jgi:anti-sigma B factor antagonist